MTEEARQAVEEVASEYVDPYEGLTPADQGVAFLRRHFAVCETTVAELEVSPLQPFGRQS